MISTRKAVALGAAGLLGIAVMAGCSSSDESTADAGTGTETSQMLPPVIVSVDQTDAAAGVGDFIDIIVDDPANTVISVDDSGILEITQGSDDGTVVMNPGAKALAAGTAVITVTKADGTTRDIVVVVS
jgi:hypothetical protein